MRIRHWILLGIGVVGLGGAALWKQSSLPSEAPVKPSALPQISNTTNSVSNPPSTLAGGSSQAVPVPVVKAPESKVFQEFTRKEDLGQYAVLQQKALLMPADKNIKMRLLKDEAFLKTLEPLLRNVPLDPDSTRMQNAALDFVYEALGSEMQGVAVEILKGVVADPSVENRSVDVADRELLAGIKAEALFNLTSAVPETRSEVESLLPGPVSQKIWSNVQERQTSNLAESSGFQTAR